MARRKPQPMAYAERKEAARKASATKAVIQKDIQQEWARQDRRAAELAVKHRKPVSWMHTRLQRLPKYGQKRRAVSKWNALVHMQSMKINKGLPDDEKKRLQELQHIAQSTKSCNDISESAMAAMKKCLEEVRVDRSAGIRKQKAARNQDLSATCRMIQEELENLDARCQTSSFFITARRTTDYLNGPEYYAYETAKGFIDHVLGMSLEEFCIKYDGYCVSGIKGIAKNDNSRRIELKQRIRETVLDGLRKVTKEPKAVMQWERYEDLVVNKYSVVLDGWPEDIEFNPGRLTLRELQLVLALLAKDKCAWRELTAEELDERKSQYTNKLASGEIPVKKRKKRCDAGKKKGKTTGNSNNNTRDNDDGDAEDDDLVDGDDASAAPRKKRRQASSDDDAEVGDELED